MASIDELTGMQVPGVSASGESRESLKHALPKSYATYRELRNDPTVALARGLSTAPVLASSWSIESKDDTPDEWVEEIEDQFQPLRDLYVESALFGQIDYGWAPYEKVFEPIDGRIKLTKLKPLLVDLTDIVVDSHGAFDGLWQEISETRIPVESALVCAARVEGTNWYGEALMENVRRVHLMWEEANIGARRYDKKVAGSRFVIYYPMGTSTINGVEKDNFLVAKEIVEQLQASGAVTIPMGVSNFVEKLGQDQDSLSWRIELLNDGSARQYSFTNRLQYLDSLKVRAMLMPERAVTEGQFGTKAEAGVHADLALTYLELQHQNITRHLNWHGVDHVLSLNWGDAARGSVWLKPAPLADESLGYLRQIYAALLANPVGFVQEYETLDTTALKDSVRLPSKEVEVLNSVRVPGMSLEQLQKLAELPAPGRGSAMAADGDGPSTGAGST